MLGVSANIGKYILALLKGLASKSTPRYLEKRLLLPSRSFLLISGGFRTLVHLFVGFIWNNVAVDFFFNFILLQYKEHFCNSSGAFIAFYSLGLL